ncbi:hypothetical protein [Pedobacter hartonius]|nr:hypothetical protein [Pedobacter hartonius]
MFSKKHGAETRDDFLSYNQQLGHKLAEQSNLRSICRHPPPCSTRCDIIPYSILETSSRSVLQPELFLAVDREKCKKISGYAFRVA